VIRGRGKISCQNKIPQKGGGVNNRANFAPLFAAKAFIFSGGIFFSSPVRMYEIKKVRQVDI
jgi:hypothetical protein